MGEVAIAESFGPLLIYFVGEPILFGKSLGDWALNFVVFIAPLSAVVFNVAELELGKVIQGLMSERRRNKSHHEEDGGQFCPLEAFLENLKEEDSESSSQEEVQEEELQAF